MERRPGPIARLTTLANRLRASKWLRGVNGKVVEAGEDGRYMPLLQHPRASLGKANSLVQHQHHHHHHNNNNHSNRNQQQQRRDREGLRLPVSNVTSNPLGEEADLDEPIEDSSAAACDWEWDPAEQTHRHNQHGGKGRMHGVPWMPSALQPHAEEEDKGGAPLWRANSNLSLHSSLGDSAGLQDDACHQRHHHPKKRHSRTRTTPNVVLPLSSEPASGQDKRGSGRLNLSSNFGSRRASNRGSSRPSTYHEPRCSSTSWYNSCDDGSCPSQKVEEASAEEEGEEGGLLGPPRLKNRRKKPSIAKRVGKRILPCCFIQ